MIVFSSYYCLNIAIHKSNMATTTIHNLSEYELTKIISYLDESPKDVVSTLMLSKYFQKTVKDNFIVKHFFNDYNHILNVCKSTAMFLESECKKYQDSLNIPHNQHMELKVIYLVITIKNKPEWPTLHMRVRNISNSWLISLGLNLQTWFNTENDIIDYFQRAALDVRDIEVSDAQVILDFHTPHKLVMFPQSDESGVIAYLLEVLKNIFPTLCKNTNLVHLIDCHIKKFVCCQQINQIANAFAAKNNIKRINTFI